MNKKQIKEELEKLNQAKENISIKLPFVIETGKMQRQKVIETEYRDTLSYVEMIRILRSFSIILRNPRHNFDTLEGATKPIKVKSQMGEWWELVDFYAVITFENYQKILELSVKLKEEHKNLEKRIKELENELAKMPQKTEEVKDFKYIEDDMGNFYNYEIDSSCDF